MRSPLRTAFVVFGLAALVAPAGAQSPVPPLGLGPYAVACSNMEQDFARMQEGETPEQYWEGIPRDDGSARYVTDLLIDLDRAPTIVVDVPDDGELFSGFAGKQYAVTMLICYPTAADNPRTDYQLPNGRIVPKMQRGADLPLLPDASQWPVLLFSHGLAGSPLSGDYIYAANLFASHGYVVVAPFHADARAANVKIEDLGDGVWAALNFSDYIAMQALRPQSLKAALDILLRFAPWRDHVDAGRVVGFGASLGGQSLLLLAGAKMTNTVGLSAKQVLVEYRLKAVVGYVPYFGQPIFPAFGRDQSGIDFMNPIPVLSIGGTADTTAPLALTRQGMKRMSGTRILVTLEGVGHYFDTPSTADIFTWSIQFLDAASARNPLTLATLQRMTGVAGGGDDRIELDYVEPYGPQDAERNVVEYRNDSLDHYFVTAEIDEAAMLDAGVVVPGWKRTGYNFKAWAPDSPLGTTTCRFFGTPGVGPNSHFYTIDPAECAKVKADPFWTYESQAFQALPSIDGTCSANDRMLVTRLYNNGMGGQASHRFTTSPSVVTDMVGQGWIVEGPVFCTPP